MLKYIVDTYKQRTSTLNIYQVGATLAIFSIVASGMWPMLRLAGVWFYFPVCLLIIFLAYFNNSTEPRLQLFADRAAGKRLLSGPNFFTAGAIGISIIAPVMFLLFLTWGQEFPHFGDSSYHLFADHAVYQLNKENFSLLFLISALFVLFFFTGQIKHWFPIALVLLLFYHCDPRLDHIYTRYPAVSRFLVQPIMAMALEQNWNSLLNAPRLVNAISLPLWIFVFRPLVIRKWPDVPVLLFGLVFFFQWDVVYYFTSGYLEPWSLICILLATENLLTNKSSNGYLLSCLLIGLAAMIKETSILLLPWFWLAGKPWKLSKVNMAKALIVGVTAIFPFIVYYYFRSLNPGRAFTLISLEQFFSMDWMIEIFNRFWFHFSGAGAALVVVVIALIPIITGVVDRFKVFCVLMSSVTVTLFFILDLGSQAYLGYPRFYLLSFMLICSILFLVEKSNIRNRYLAVITVLIIGAPILNGMKLVPYLIAATQSDVTRNFTEHYDSPLYLPIQQLIRKADSEKGLARVKLIKIHNPIGIDISNFKLERPKLAKRFELSVYKDSSCVCDEENGAILIPYVYYSWLNTYLLVEGEGQSIRTLPRSKHSRFWEESNTNKLYCLEEIVSTCEKVFSESIDGEIIGILGINKKAELHFAQQND